MVDNKLQKLENLLQERSKKIESIKHFDEYFHRFAHVQLKELLSTINHKLYNHTNESLRLFFENPYEEVKTRYFAMIQLIPEQNRRNSFHLDNTRHFPSLIFEGNEINATIEISTRIKSSKPITEIEIEQLNEDKLFDIIYTFLDQVYKV